MTDGFAVGATDQRYKCKDCGYSGSFAVEKQRKKTKADKEVEKELKKLSHDIKYFEEFKEKEPLNLKSKELWIFIVDIIAFCAVLYLFLNNYMGTTKGLVMLSVCFVVLGVSLFLLYSRE